MISLNKLRLVFLMCGFFTFWEPVKTRTCENGSTTTGNGCPSLLTCGNGSYNPRNDTCCKGKLTVGLSERMSQCCGGKAYNPLNEICCNLTVKPKPSHDAKCCGEVPYNQKKNVCCSNNLLEKRTPDHLCCYGKLFDSSIENCCQNVFPRIQLKINNSKVCEKNLTCDPTFSGKNYCEDSNPRRQDQTYISEKNATSTQKQVCTFQVETEVYHKKEGFDCCGLYYFNTTLWSCNEDKLGAKI